ncbi:putative acyl-CoA dehydrogenase [Corynebacterium gerontici]|uniref:Putative acyl-CoA dehydrogenase n=2 Tax=Corynebacterium gerontici TaxID=2079234 RepID=A0A3G6IXP8_9CORY|nr:putative acyl-CoA dehydrogenase [Corynebacterium gerontici]
MMEFANHRAAFGKTIDNYQYVQDRIVRARVNATTVEALSREALTEMQSQMSTVSMTSSIAKMLGAEAVLQTAQDTMRVLGHSGYETGEVSKLLSDAQGLVIAGGTIEMQKKNIFSQLSKGSE